MSQDFRDALESYRAGSKSAHDRISQVYPFLVCLLLVLTGTFSLFFTSHKLDTLGLSLVTAAALLLSPGPYLALMRPLTESVFLDFVGKVHKVWLGVLALIGLVGIVLLVIGGLESELEIVGSPSRLHYLLGVACTVVVILGLLPAWLAKATKDYGDAADSLDRASKRRWSKACTAAGALFFLVGTILQFVEATR
jgi:hypothetical protein